MSDVTEKELQDARARFAARVNVERAKLGLPPLAPGAVEKPVDPYMERWKTQGATRDQTRDFIRMNAERADRGEPILGANGQPIVAAAAVVVPPPPVIPADDFFSTPVGGEKIAKRYG